MARYQSKEYGQNPPMEREVIPCVCRTTPKDCRRHPPSFTPEEIAGRALHPEVRTKAASLAQTIREFEAMGVTGPKLYRAVFGASFVLPSRVKLWTDYSTDEDAPQSGGKAPSVADIPTAGTVVPRNGVL